MKLPRDLSGKDLARELETPGYAVTHQTGSHVRLTTHQGGVHHVTIPAHDPLRIGTLNAILNGGAQHFLLTRDQLLERLFS